MAVHSVLNISAGQAITNEHLAKICQALAKTFGLKKPELTLINASAPISIDCFMDAKLAYEMLGWSPGKSLKKGINKTL